MKVVAYGIKPHEKILLAKVNLKMHDITIIANELTLETVNYASGKNALVLTHFNSLTTQLIKIISGYGISLIITWDNADNSYLKKSAIPVEISLIHLSKSKDEYLRANSLAIRLANETIAALNSWQNKN